MKNKFYNFVTTKTSNDLYLYGAIISGEKWDETDVTFQDFKDKIDELTDNSVLNIYQNSPGGDCFACSSMVALLQRAKDRGITINAYIDGLSASCSSWISCMADNLYLYTQSILMLHKPMSCTWGNADEMQKEIDILDKIQNDVMMPIYMKKVKEGITEDQIQELVNNETWLSATEIQEYFDCILLEDKKQIACSVDKNLFNRYNNVPKELLNLADKEVENMSKIKDETIEEDVVEETIIEEETEVIEETVTPNDKNSEEVSDNKIKEFEDKISDLTDKLNQANETIISLNETISNLQEIANKYNSEQEEKAKEDKQNKISEKKDYFKNKFEKANARDKFETDEVQALINDCIDNKESLIKLNEMVIESFDNLSFENKPLKTEQTSNVDNLLDIEESSAEKFGFK